MRKLLVSLLALSGVSAFAASNGSFQQFDNQYNLGYGMSQYGLQNGAGSTAQVTNQFINLEVERLFNDGIWMDVNANMVTSSLTNQPAGTIGAGAGPLNQSPTLGGLNAKVGYSFQLIKRHLLLTPYALVGRNTNLAASTLVTNEGANITNDFYYTGGVGGRLEYRINKYIDVYADQLAAYNWDQSGPTLGYQPQNNMMFTSTIGAKFNLYRNFQLGVNGFYNNYQYQAAAPADTTGTSIYQAQNGLGGMVTVGLTY
jgi:hypothetical protein